MTLFFISSSHCSSSSAVGQQWACCTLADWHWRILTSGKSLGLLPPLRVQNILLSLKGKKMAIFHLLVGIARTTQSLGTKWRPISSTRYEPLQMKTSQQNHVVFFPELCLSEISKIQNTLPKKVKFSIYLLISTKLFIECDSFAFFFREDWCEQQPFTAQPMFSLIMPPSSYRLLHICCVCVCIFVFPAFHHKHGLLQIEEGRTRFLNPSVILSSPVEHLHNADWKCVVLSSNQCIC